MGNIQFAEWRFGFSNPTMYAATTNEATNNVELAGHYFGNTDL